MPANITYSPTDLMVRVRQVCDIESDDHVSDDLVLIAIKNAYRELLDLRYMCGIHDYDVRSVTFNTVVGQTEYPLTSSGIVNEDDFYRLTDLYVVENSGSGSEVNRKVQQIQPSQLISYTAPKAVVPMKMYYIPMSLLGDATQMDAGHGYDDFIVFTAACYIKMKREEDYQLFFRRKKEIETRIRAIGSVDFGEPPRISRKRHTFRDPWNYFAQSVNAYIMRGNNIELYCLSGYIR